MWKNVIFAPENVIPPRPAHIQNAKGKCGMGTLPVVARASLHHWEEPCISGTNGSGTVFFSGCSLQCVYCQNSKISWGRFGKEISIEHLQNIYAQLIQQGAHNINLVNPTHFIKSIACSLSAPLPVPVVYNSSGYENVSSLKLLQGKVQIYLPDLKYADNSLAQRYSGAPDYFETACSAIEEMYKQVGSWEMDENGVLQKGVIIRHLILPGQLENTFAVIDWVKKQLKEKKVLFSLMCQYTPFHLVKTEKSLQSINRRLNKKEYAFVQEYLLNAGISNGYMQELSSAKEEYVPSFNLSGV